MPPTAGDRILNSQSSENQEHLAMHAMATESLVRVSLVLSDVRAGFVLRPSLFYLNIHRLRSEK